MMVLMLLELLLLSRMVVVRRLLLQVANKVAFVEKAGAAAVRRMRPANITNGTSKGADACFFVLANTDLSVCTAAAAVQPAVLVVEKLGGRRGERRGVLARGKHSAELGGDGHSSVKERRRALRLASNEWRGEKVTLFPNAATKRKKIDDLDEGKKERRKERMGRRRFGGFHFSLLIPLPPFPFQHNLFLTNVSFSIWIVHPFPTHDRRKQSVFSRRKTAKLGPQ